MPPWVNGSVAQLETSGGVELDARSWWIGSSEPWGSSKNWSDFEFEELELGRNEWPDLELANLCCGLIVLCSQITTNFKPCPSNHFRKVDSCEKQSRGFHRDLTVDLRSIWFHHQILGAPVDFHGWNLWQLEISRASRLRHCWQMISVSAAQITSWQLEPGLLLRGESIVVSWVGGWWVIPSLLLVAPCGYPMWPPAWLVKARRLGYAPLVGYKCFSFAWLCSKLGFQVRAIVTRWTVTHTVETSETVLIRGGYVQSCLHIQMFI